MSPTPTPLSPETLDTATLVRDAVNKAFYGVKISDDDTGNHLAYDARRIAFLAATYAAESCVREFTALTATILRQRSRETGEGTT